jgi:hypothetical protein|tara:strand:- start:208 stop:339 length:132 start_codon:yes stop_codon:yes gene_type:complete
MFPSLISLPIAEAMSAGPVLVPTAFVMAVSAGSVMFLDFGSQG